MPRHIMLVLLLLIVGNQEFGLWEDQFQNVQWVAVAGHQSPSRRGFTPFIATLTNASLETFLTGCDLLQ